MSKHFMIQCLNKNELALSSIPFILSNESENINVYQLVTDLNFSLITEKNVDLKFRIIEVNNINKNLVFSFCCSKLNNNHLEELNEINIKTLKPFTLHTNYDNSSIIKSMFTYNNQEIVIEFTVYKYKGNKLYLCCPSFTIQK